VWEAVVGEELYSHRGDVEVYDIDHFEDINVAHDPSFLPVKAWMEGALRLGWRAALPKPPPVDGGGWRSHQTAA
jgi:hypothetical protein